MKPILAAASAGALALAPMLALAEQSAVVGTSQNATRMSDVAMVNPSTGVRVTPAASLDVTQSQASPGADAAKATAVQGVAGGKALNVNPDGTADGVTKTSPVTSSATTLITFSPTELLGMNSLYFAATQVGSGGTVVVDQAADGSTFNTNGMFWRTDSTGSATGSQGSPTTAMSFCAPVTAAGMRLRLSAYSSGNYTFVATAKRGVCSAPYNVVLSSSSGATDGTTNSLAGIQVGGYNGSTFKRWATASAASTSTGDGQQSIAPMAQCDDASQASPGENGYAFQRMDCLNHALITKPYESSANQWSYAAAASGIVNTTTAVTIKAAAGAGLRNYITSCQVSSDALGAAAELAIRDGAAGTVIWRHKLQTAAQPGLPVSFPVPLRGSANTLLEAVTLTAVTGGVYVDCQGYVAP